MTEGPRPVVFEGTTVSDSVIEAEKEAHRRRAERFGTEYIDPSKRSDLRMEFRKQRFKKEGFKTGLDLFDEEEVARMQVRAQRFQTELKLPEYRPAELPEDEVKKQQRAARFGVEYTADKGALMDIDVLEERKEHGWDIPRRPEAIHLYGVDCMSTADCLSYFSDYGPTFVEWIDDSSCNVLFEDDYTAKRALVGRGKPLPPDNTAPDTAGLDPTDINNAPFLWHKGEDFKKGSTAIPLMYRMATTADVKPPHGKKFSRYLWKMPVKKAQRLQKEEVRQRHQVQNGEDVQMNGTKSTRNERKKRKRQRGDVDMVDAADLPEEDAAEEDLPEAKLPKADVADLRELLRRKDERSGLFSSADAFIPLSDDDEDAEQLEAIEEEGEEEEVVEADGAEVAADVPLQTHDGSEVAAAADVVPDR
ncbi:g2354 [Coccomyxa elongata]